MSTPELFGTDGIRGHVGQFPLRPDFVLRLGLATGAVLQRADPRPTVVIGRDTRDSGQMLQSSLVAGLLAGGVAVIDVGVITTPGVAYLVRKLDAQAGVVISASHNPVDQNGIKLFDAQGLKSSEATECEIERLAADPKLFETNLARRFGRCIDGDGLQELYVESLVGEHRDLRLDRLTVVMDCANGAAYALAPECFGRLGARVIAIHASPTGLNINDGAGSEHVRRRPDDLGQLIRQYDADLGLAFDGDADRVILVDEEGRMVDGDHMLAILARYLDRQGRLVGRTVVGTSMRNSGFLRFVEATGLGFIETKVGDKYVVEKLLELNRQHAAPEAFALGGEQSGHIILLDDQHTTGDGIRTALYVTRAFIESGAGSLAELASCIVKTPQIIASAHVSAKPPLSSIPDLKPLLENEDAARARLPGLLRMNLRYSGTEPLFRAMLEADSRHSEAELADEVWAICRAVQAASDTQDGPIEVLNCARGGLLYPRS